MENPKLTKQGKIWEREKEFLPCLSFDRYFVFLVFCAQQQQNKETETDSIIIITAIFVAPYLTNNGEHSMIYKLYSVNNVYIKPQT